MGPSVGVGDAFSVVGHLGFGLLGLVLMVFGVE